MGKLGFSVKKLKLDNKAIIRVSKLYVLRSVAQTALANPHTIDWPEPPTSSSSPSLAAAAAAAAAAPTSAPTSARAKKPPAKPKPPAESAPKPGRATLTATASASAGPGPFSARVDLSVLAASSDVLESVATAAGSLRSGNLQTALVGLGQTGASRR